MALEDTVKKVVQVDVSQAVTSMGNLKEATNDAGKSFTNLKQYNTYIESLKASLVGLNADSKEYKERLKEIRSEQDKYNRILKDTNTQIKAEKGSYNERAQELAKLKKEFKETGDEVKRTDLAKRISKINDELKDMDASIGIYSRNVGNYQTAFTSALRDLGDGFDALIPGAKKAFDFVDKLFKGFSGGGSIAEQFKEIFNFKLNGNFVKQGENIDVNTKSLEKLTKTTANWQKVEAASEAIQIKSLATTKDKIEALDDTTERIKTLQKALDSTRESLKEYEKNAEDYYVTHGKMFPNQEYLDTIDFENIKIAKQEDEIRKLYEEQTKSNKKKEESIGLLSKLSTAWKEMSTVAKVGLGAAVAAFTALVAVAVHFIKKAIEARKEMIELQNALRAGASGAAEQRVAIEQLAKKYGELGDSATKKKKFLEDYKDEIEKTGVAVNDVNKADDLFINNTANYVKALENRAKAQAAQNLAIKKYEEYYEKLADLQRLQAEAPEQKQLQQLGNSSFGTVYTIDTRKTKDQVQKDIDELTAKTQKEIDIIYKFAEDSQKAVGDILGSKNDSGIKLNVSIDESELKDSIEKISDTIKKDDTLDEALKIWGRSQLFNLDATEKQLLQLKLAYSKEKALLEEHGLNTVALTEEYEKAKSDVISRSVDERLKKLDEEAALRIFLNEKTKQSEYKRVKETLEINNELLNSKKTELESAINDDNLLIEEKERFKTELSRINAEIVANNQAMVDNQKKAAKEWVTAYQNLSTSLGSIFGSLASYYEQDAQYKEGMSEEEEAAARKNFETMKSYQRAQVLVTGIAGAAGALAAPFLSPADTILPMTAKIILGATESAAQIAAMMLSLNQINRTQFEGGSTGGAVTPTTESTAYVPQYTQNVTGQSDTVNLANAIGDVQSDQRVYILESDLQASGKKVQVRETETIF